MFFVILIRMIFFVFVMGIGGVFKVFLKSYLMLWIIVFVVIVFLGFIMILYVIVMLKFMIM